MFICMYVVHVYPDLFLGAQVVEEGLTENLFQQIHLREGIQVHIFLQLATLEVHLSQVKK